MGILVVDPMIQLILDDGSAVTPEMECFDYRLPHQTCKNKVNVDYFFYNLTNKDEVSLHKLIHFLRIFRLMNRVDVNCTA